MLDPNAPPDAASYANWAAHALTDLELRFLPQLVAGARRLESNVRPSYDLLAQSCAALEAAVDAVDFGLVQAPGLLRRIIWRKQDVAIAVFRRQLAQVTTQWCEVREAASAIERSFASAAQAEKRAFLEIGLSVKDFRPQLTHVAQWIDLASKHLSTVDEDLEQLRFDLHHVQLAEARAQLLLEELQRLALTRSSLADLVNTDLTRSVNVWEIRTEELLEQPVHSSTTKRLLVELTPKHIALRRLVHKTCAACSQAQQQEAEIGEIATDIGRALSRPGSGTDWTEFQ